jgi:hypothetical protein
VPLGCGSSGGYASVPPSHGGPELSEDVVEQLKDCVKLGPAPSTPGQGDSPTYYAILFDVHVTEIGGVRSVDVKDSQLGGGEMEACMAGVLRRARLPVPAIPALATQRDPHSRALMASPALAALAPVALTPVVLTGIGIVVVVAVAVYIAEDVVEAARRRRKEVKEKCNNRLMECLENPQQPEWNRGIFGDRKACESCFYPCMDKNGKWPHDKCPPPGYRPGDRWE